MKKLLLIATIFAFAFLTSCGSISSLSLMPTAVNTVKSVALDELNLTSNDYEVLDRIEAQASVVVTITANSFVIEDPEGTFQMNYFKQGETLTLASYNGVVRAGYLARDYGTIDLDNPDDVVRRIAIYRLINLCKEQDGDGIIEPIISTNVEESKSGRSTTVVTFRCTVSGRVVKLKTAKSKTSK